MDNFITMPIASNILINIKTNRKPYKSKRIERYVINY